MVIDRSDWSSVQRAVERSMGRCDGSGFCLFDGTRDLSWYRKRRKSADVLLKKLRKVAGRRKGCKIITDGPDDDYRTTIPCAMGVSRHGLG